MDIPLSITIIIICIILNAVVVACNTAFSTVNSNKIKQFAAGEGCDKAKSEKASKVLKLLEKPLKLKLTNRLLNYIFLVVGLTFTVEIPYSDAVSALVFIVVAASIGEIFPRKLAQQHSETFAMAFANMQWFLTGVLTPIVFIFNLIADLFLVLFRQKTNVEESRYSEEEVMSILEEGERSGEFKEEGKKMIHSIFEFDDELAYEIMTPRTDVFLIDINDPVDDYIDNLMELRYSRIPVCEDESDNIIGILHIKDYLIKAREQGFDNVDIRSILRKPYFVPETKNIDSLFFELQKAKQHIAILIDEYGGFSGIVTMEDIIEEVMGDIEDEYDPEEEAIKVVDDNTYLVDGNVYLSDFNEEAETHLESESSETIGGLIIDVLGEIPGEEDKDRRVEMDNFIFTILSVKERRIEKVRVEILREVEEAEEEDE